jgi:hypothetical protein
MTVQYEAVRARVLGQAGGLRSAQGLAVLQQRGIPAWLAVWAACMPTATNPPPLAGETPGTVVPGSEQFLVRVLLSLALRGRRQAGR